MELKLIKLEDIEYIFDTNIQKWNQNVVFDKKKTMEKISIMTQMFIH